MVFYLKNYRNILLFSIILQLIFLSNAYPLKSVLDEENSNIDNYFKIQERKEVPNYNAGTSYHVLTSQEVIDDEFWKKQFGEDYKSAVHLQVNSNLPQNPTHSFVLDGNLQHPLEDKIYESMQSESNKLHKIDPNANLEALTKHLENLLYMNQNSDMSIKQTLNHQQHQQYQQQPMYVNFPDNQKVFEVHESNNYSPIVVNEPSYTKNHDANSKYWHNEHYITTTTTPRIPILTPPKQMHTTTPTPKLYHYHPEQNKQKREPKKEKHMHNKDAYSTQVVEDTQDDGNIHILESVLPKFVSFDNDNVHQKEKETSDEQQLKLHEEKKEELKNEETI